VSPFNVLTYMSCYYYDIVIICIVLHRFDQHKLVVKAIGLIICTNLEEGKPSWKQLSKKQRDSWFDIFKVINALIKLFWYCFRIVSNVTISCQI
jgi:hypothetical protein